MCFLGLVTWRSNRFFLVGKGYYGPINLFYWEAKAAETYPSQAEPKPDRNPTTYFAICQRRTERTEEHQERRHEMEERCFLHSTPEPSSNMLLIGEERKEMIRGERGFYNLSIYGLICFSFTESRSNLLLSTIDIIPNLNLCSYNDDNWNHTLD